MKKSLVKSGVLFEVIDILGRKIRTTKTYWRKIREIKHKELHHDVREVKTTLKTPDEIRKSVTDETMYYGDVLWGPYYGDGPGISCFNNPNQAWFYVLAKWDDLQHQ